MTKEEEKKICQGLIKDIEEQIYNLKIDIRFLEREKLAAKDKELIQIQNSNFWVC